jgi:hypothetical protein
MTPNHRCLLLNKRSGNLYLKKAENYPVGSHLSQIQSGLFYGEKQESYPFLKLIVALQADGKRRKNDYVVWLKKSRKIKRLHKILFEAGEVAWTEQRCKSKSAGYGFVIKMTGKINKYLDENKTFNRKLLLQLTSDCREIFLDELEFWDGCRKFHVYYSTNLQNCDVVQEIAILTNRRSNLRIRQKLNCKDGIKRKPCGEISLTKKISTYIKTLKKDLIPYNDLTYCITMPASTVIVRRNGKVSITGNSGQELRVLSEVSKDANMVAAFNKNYDLHLFTANRVFNLNLADKSFINSTKEHDEASRKFKEKRHQAKNGINFPTVYGAYPKRIAKDNKVSVEEATRWLDEFDKLYPGVKIAIERTKEELRKNGYVTTLMGRRRRFPYYASASKFGRGGMERQAFNFKIQGFSADMMKTAAGKILPILPKYQAKYVLTIHDELVWGLPAKYAEAFSCIVKNIMENCVCLSVPIVVDVDIVNSYGD